MAGIVIPTDSTEAVTAETVAAVERFTAAFDRHDVDGIMAAMTVDCLFENTAPGPDGEQFVGQAAVRAFWERFFAGAPAASFTVEDAFAIGDRCVVRWLYRWAEDAPDRPGHVRGVDLFRVRDSKVAEKRSYVKG